MTRYTLDPATRTLIAYRHRDSAPTEQTIVRLPERTRRQTGFALADALTSLSVAFVEWCVRRPDRTARALAALERIDRGEDLRQLTSAIGQALRDPDPPDVDLQPLYAPAERAAHRAGRALAEIDDPAVSAQVSRHLRAELVSAVAEHAAES